MIISIQSQVVHGHVGNSAALFPMQLHGQPVTPVPTTLLSNHPHYSSMHGQVLDAGLLADLLRGVRERGLVEKSRLLITGYLGSAENAEVVAQFVSEARRANPRMAYLCDPVMGDADLGIFVASGVQTVIAERLVGQADLITPNQFEFELLTGLAVRTAKDLQLGFERLASRGVGSVIVTGALFDDTPEGMLDTFILEDKSCWRIRTPRLPTRPAGTGDLLTALVAAKLASGAGLREAAEHAVAATFAVLERTLEDRAYEMLLVASAEDMLSPRSLFSAVKLVPGEASGGARSSA